MTTVRRSICPSASQRRLLAALALAAGATLRPEYLSDLLEVSAGALRTTVSRLRSRLGETVIRTDAVGYRITCPVDIDLFTGPARSTARRRRPGRDRSSSRWTSGTATRSTSSATSPGPKRKRRGSTSSAASPSRIAPSCSSGGRAPGEAVAALEAHVAIHPLRDRAHGLLIQALASDGRQAEALRAYQDYRTLLAEETGTEPSALVRSIERRVAAGWSG